MHQRGLHEGRAQEGVCIAVLRFFYTAQLDEAQANRWNRFQDGIPSVHFQQTPDWAHVARDDGQLIKTVPSFFWVEEDDEVKLTALVTGRELRFPRVVSYEIDGGPVFSDLSVFEQALPEIMRWCRRSGLRLRVSPRRELGSGGDEIETALERFGFVRRRIYGSWATLKVDLDKSEAELMSELHHSTRRLVRKAEKAGVAVVRDDSYAGWGAFQRLQQEMSDRKGTGCLSLPYLERLSRVWLRGGAGGTLLFAVYQQRPIAAMLLVRWRDTTTYMAGGSSKAFPKLPTSHLLFWEAIRWAKAQGCSTFDLGGYSMVARPGDSLWGVNQFKRGVAPNTPPVRYVAVHEWFPSVPALLAASLRDSPVPGTSSSNRRR